MKIGNVFVGIIALFLLIGPFQSPISTGIHGWRTTDTSEAKVVNTAGVTTYDFELAHDLYQAATGEVILISSTIEETPVASSYDEGTQTLTITNLTTDTDRTLTVQYYAETDDTVMRALGPFLSVLIFGGAAFAILFSIWQSVKGRGR